jgi:hypothetical protein
MDAITLSHHAQLVSVRKYEAPWLTILLDTMAPVAGEELLLTSPDIAAFNVYAL